MPVIFSRSCEYGIQALLYLAQQSRERHLVQLREISSSLHIPHHFLSKIMQTLAHYELVISHKGLNGGFELGRVPSKIRLIDIVRALDGDAFLDHCVLGLTSCSPESPCSVHQDWLQAKSIIFDMLCMKTIADFNSGHQHSATVQ